MQLQADEIVAIPPNRVKFFGTTGKMLLPSPATIAALIMKIPEHRLTTTELLRRDLAAEFDVEAVCPVTTQKALQTVARDPDRQVAYWRVVNTNGGLNSRYPGGVEGHAARLRDEGFAIETGGKAPKVRDFKDSLIRLRSAS